MYIGIPLLYIAQTVIIGFASRPAETVKLSWNEDGAKGRNIFLLQWQQQSIPRTGAVPTS